MDGEEPSILLSFISLLSRYYSSSVATRTVSLGPVELLMSVLPLYSLVLCIPFSNHFVSEKEEKIKLKKLISSMNYKAWHFFPSFFVSSLHVIIFLASIFYITS